MIKFNKLVIIVKSVVFFDVINMLIKIYMLLIIFVLINIWLNFLNNDWMKCIWLLLLKLIVLMFWGINFNDVFINLICFESKIVN